mmetsp:Transcript_108500/g.312564  ORF Transcript_108500/g.312564 Transcript_108500/m.312564 type:complete len:224 (-) Transcript_108500:1582-2253(-)
MSNGRPDRRAPSTRTTRSCRRLSSRPFAAAPRAQAAGVARAPPHMPGPRGHHEGCEVQPAALRPLAGLPRLPRRRAAARPCSGGSSRHSAGARRRTRQPTRVPARHARGPRWQPRLRLRLSPTSPLQLLQCRHVATLAGSRVHPPPLPHPAPPLPAAPTRPPRPCHRRRRRKAASYRRLPSRSRVLPSSYLAAHAAAAPHWALPRPLLPLPLRWSGPPRRYSC